MYKSVKWTLIYFPAFSTVYLVTIFAKNEQSNLSKAERSTVRQLVTRLRDALGG